LGVAQVASQSAGGVFGAVASALLVENVARFFLCGFISAVAASSGDAFSTKAHISTLAISGCSAGRTRSNVTDSDANVIRAHQEISASLGSSAIFTDGGFGEANALNSEFAVQSKTACGFYASFVESRANASIVGAVTACALRFFEAIIAECEILAYAITLDAGIECACAGESFAAFA